MLVFGITLGCFLAIYVAIGSLASSMNFKIEIIQHISDLYVTYNYQQTLLANLQKILIGALWAFADGFLVGSSLVWLYQHFDAGKSH